MRDLRSRFRVLFPDPLVKYLYGLPDAPEYAWPEAWPTGVSSLWYLAGEISVDPQRSNPTFDRLVTDLWRGYLDIWPRLRSWVEGDSAFRPPRAWPPLVAEVFPPWISPLVLAQNTPPTGRGDRVRSWFYNSVLWSDGVDTLYAYANGWPVTEEEFPLMRRGAEVLMGFLPFLLWVFHPNLNSMPLMGEGSFLDRVKVRATLCGEPLRLSEEDFWWTIPCGYEAEDILALPRLPFDPARGGRMLRRLVKHRPVLQCAPEAKA